MIASVPTVAQFDRMIAKLDVGGKDVWLDPSDEHGQYGVAFAGQDNLVLPLDKGGSELGARPAARSLDVDLARRRRVHARAERRSRGEVHVSS